MANPYLWAGLANAVGTGLSEYLSTRMTLQEYMRQQAQQKTENERQERQIGLQERQQTRLEEQTQREMDMLRFQQQMGRENEQWKAAQPMAFTDALAAAGEQAKTLGGAAGQSYLTGALQSGRTSLPPGMAGGQGFIEQFAGAPAGSVLPSIVGSYIPGQTPAEVDMARKAFDSEQNRKLRRVTIAKDTILGFLRQAPALGAVNWNEVRGIIDQQLSAIGETGIEEEELKAAVAQAQSGVPAAPVAPSAPVAEPAKLPAIQPTPSEIKVVQGLKDKERELDLRERDVATREGSLALREASVGRGGRGGGGARTGGGPTPESDIIPLTAPEVRDAADMLFNTPAMKQAPQRIRRVLATDKYWKRIPDTKPVKYELNGLGKAEVRKINREELALSQGKAIPRAEPTPKPKAGPPQGKRVSAFGSENETKMVSTLQGYKARKIKPNRKQWIDDVARTAWERKHQRWSKMELGKIYDSVY